MPENVFDSNNPLCKKCWGKWVKAQCRGEVEGFDKCPTFREGCTDCLQDFCKEGNDEGLCLKKKQLNGGKSGNP